MPAYHETIGDHLKRMRLGNIPGTKIVRRGKLPKGPSKPMVPKHHIAITAGPCGRRDAELYEQALAIPADVLMDRDRRMAMQPHSLTASLMGDPPAPDWHKRNA